jgi:hypothetical protein
MEYIILTYQVEEGGFWAEVASERVCYWKGKSGCCCVRRYLKVGDAKGDAKIDDFTPLATLWASTSSLLDPIDSPKIPKR